jgi:uncharacterized Fe-S cluster protein YjdI
MQIKSAGLQMEKKIEYSNGDITIIWQPGLCQHSGICVRMLPDVYQPNNRPWVKPENAATDQLIYQINHCPSGALSFRFNHQKNTDES